MCPNSNIIALFIRRDLRASDHPVFHHLSSVADHGFTHLLPVYAFPPNQVEVSGFVSDGAESPYPKARSSVGGYFRCGPHRAKFLAESVWALKETLEDLQSGLLIRVGMAKDVIEHLHGGLKAHDHHIGAVWVVSHEGVEEKRDETDLAAFCEAQEIQFRLWTDEKYFIDDRDIGLKSIDELPDIFTTYRKSVEPLREKPREVLPTPARASLPPFPDHASIPDQKPPFQIPKTLAELVGVLVKPVEDFLPNLPPFPDDAQSARPFMGGEAAAQERLQKLIESGCIKNYKDTRNALDSTEFSTKLSAYLAQGCITSRQIHHALLGYEDGTDGQFQELDGFGSGENEGTKVIRVDLLWRDYMRLCDQKYKHKLFRLEGVKNEKKLKWKFPSKDQASKEQDPSPERVAEIIQRFTTGTTGMGLIDASQRELLHTGYTSNRARQNVASFLAKILGIDWRIGAEWYEMLLVDYDVSSNWGNWQYCSGVGNDPRDGRIFNPVKQAFDYDKDGSYVRSWVPELSKLEKLENVFQAWTASEEDIKAAGLEGNLMVTDPVKRIEFSVDGKPPPSDKRPFFRRRRQHAAACTGSVTAAGGGGGETNDAAGSEDGKVPILGQPGETTGHVASEAGGEGRDGGRRRRGGNCYYRGQKRGRLSGRGGRVTGRGSGGSS